MNGQKILKKIKKRKKFIYLISPNKIDNNFFSDLKSIFKLKVIAFFQLRLKNYSKNEILNLGRKIKIICRRFDVKLIINDDPYLTKKIDADGCHLGQNDFDVRSAKKILKNKIIGKTCHNSKKLINNALKEKVNYIALGAFFKTKTKKVRFKATLNTLRWAKNKTKTPIVAIGGITDNNYKNLLLHKANFLAISGYVWDNKKLSPKQAIEKLL